MRMAAVLALLPVLALSHAALAGDKSKADEALEKANKERVLTCLDLMFNQKKLDEARTLCFGDTYIQHNPLAADGVDTVLNFFAGYHKGNPDSSLEVKRAVAKGDMVWVHSHGRANPESRGIAVVDIFRLEDGKLAEHWDVVQPVPEKSANENTMF